MIRRFLLAALFIVGLSSPAIAQKVCTSNCANDTACDWNAGPWVATGGATCPPNASDERWVISAGDTVTLADTTLNVGSGIIDGHLTFGTDMTTNVDATYGMRRLRITNPAGVDAVAISATGIWSLRGSQGIIFDNAAGVARVSQATTGVLDIQGFTFDTTIKAIERVPATTEACGTTNGFLWLITPADGFQYAKKFRRVLFKNGKARTRQLEIVSVDPNDMCTAAGAPFSCCTNPNAGTCTTSKSLAVCTDLLDPASCVGANNPATANSGTTWCSGAGTGLSLQRLTPHTANIKYQTLGAGAVYRHPVPGYNPVGQCTGTDAPFEGCTGFGTGTKMVTDAQVYPAVGDQITIIDDVMFTDTTPANGFFFAPANATNLSTVTAPVFKAMNAWGLGDPSPHRGMFFFPLAAGQSFNDITYNNLHDYIGQDVMKIRGFSNFKVQWNVIHDAQFPRATEEDAAIAITAALSIADGGDVNVTTSSSNVEMSDNFLYANEGDGVAWGPSESSYPIYGTNIRILRNLILGGCGKSSTAGDSNSFRTCNGVRMAACRGCLVEANVIADSCSQDNAGNILSGSGISFQVATTSTFSPSDVGYNNAFANTVADHNWIVNSCDYGINTANNVTNAGQKVASTHNYISHERVVGIYGGRAYGNVIANFGLLCANTGTGIEYPIRTASNFLIGADDTTDSLCATSSAGIHMRNLGGNTNNADVTMDDDIITRMDSANSTGIYLDTTVPYNVTSRHQTFDMDGTSLNSIFRFTSSDSSLGKTYSAADYAATHGNASPVSRCSTTGGLTDTFGASLLNTSSVAAESLIDNFDGNCSSTGTVTWGYGIYPNRANLDYNWPVGSPYLTAASSSSPFGSRAFYFDRDSMNQLWGGALTWIAPFPVNVSNGNLPNTSPAQPYNIDTDGDGVIDLFDNCDLTFNPSQYDGDGDGKGCACDASGDTCP